MSMNNEFVVSVGDYMTYSTSVGKGYTRAAITWRIRKGLDLDGVIRVEKVGKQYVLWVTAECKQKIDSCA